MNKLMKELVFIGFGQPRYYKTTAWKYATMLMDRCCELGLAKPHDFGCGKGKYDSDVKTEIIVEKLLNDPDVLYILDKYRLYKNK